MSGVADNEDTFDRDSVFANYKSVLSRQFAVSLVVETIGVMFFQILGATATPTMAPWVNGFALAVWIYVAATISGGHLNPAVSVSIFACGFFPLAHAALYMALQILGAILGSLVTAGLVPGASVRMGDGAPGCFDRTVIDPRLSDAQVFGWEVVMTFTLISCVYACGVAKPGHGSHTPLAVGLALLCCAGSGGQYTGAALNPARVLGPRSVFLCGEGTAWIYIVGQFFASFLASCVFALVSGPGPLIPYQSMRLLDLTWPEACWMWINGSPPARLRQGSRDNAFDAVLARKKTVELRDRQERQAQQGVGEGHQESLVG